MATTQNGIAFDKRFFQEFGHLLKGAGPTCRYGLLFAVRNGLLPKDALMEQVYSDISGIPRLSIDGMDFENGDDMKTVVSVIKNNHAAKGQWTHSFPIQRVSTKERDLIIVGLNTVTDRFHYFRIEHEKFQHCGTVVEIVIETATIHDGTQPNFTGIPTRYKIGPQKGGLRQWWDCEKTDIWDLIEK